MKGTRGNANTDMLARWKSCKSSQTEHPSTRPQALRGASGRARQGGRAGQQTKHGQKKGEWGHLEREQQFLHVVVLGQVQCRQAVVVLAVHVGPAVDEKRHDLNKKGSD